MFKATKGILTTLAITALLMMSAAATFGQTTGSVTMTATVSNFVELTSGGAVTLTGNSGGSIITDGTANSPWQSLWTWAKLAQATPIVL